MGSCAADFFSGTPTHAAEPSSARIAKLRQEINSSAPLTHTPPPDFNATVAPPEKLADLQHPDAKHLLLGINLEGLRSRSPLMFTPPPDFNATVAPPEKLADLQHPDAKHLLLGINLEGLREACELVGFPYMQYKDGMRNDAWATGKHRDEYKYKRDDHPEMAWVDKAYPNSGYLGYDFCCAVKAWLKANGHENESICQVLLKRGSKNVRPANLFYSHTQGVWLPHTIKRVREGIAAHKDQLPQPTEEAKALAAEQRARLAELDALMKAASAAKDWETYKKLVAERNNLAACPADEAHLFFWLGSPPPPPID